MQARPLATPITRIENMLTLKATRQWPGQAFNIWAFRALSGGKWLDWPSFRQ